MARYNVCDVTILRTDFYNHYAYLCEGVCRDEISNWNYRSRASSTITTESLYYNTDLSSMNQIYSVLGLGKWFATEKEAQECAERDGLKPMPEFSDAKIYQTLVAFLNCTEIEPLTFPQNVYFHKSEKRGGVACRINAHPERDGLRSPGKFYFPDKKAFPYADIGPAIITGITRETDRYGFVSGALQPVENVPTFKELLDWVWEKDLDMEILIIDHPARGKYYLSINKEDGEGFSYGNIRWARFSDPAIEDFITNSSLYIGYEESDAEKYCVRRVDTHTLFVEDAWGKEWNLAKLEQMAQSTIASDPTILKTVKWKIINTPAGNDTINAAIELGIVDHLMDRHGLELYVMNLDRLLQALNLTPEQYMELISVIKEYNDQTIAKLKLAGLNKK